MARGIPVPPVIPEGSKAFILCVPDDPFFYGVVMGAIKTMTFRYYWQGTTEQIDAVTERMTTMYYDYQEQVGCMICEMVAECFETGNEALIEALANAIRTNPLLQAAIADALTQQGGGVPGKPISPGQATGNLLPDNVRTEEGECIEDNLWGAMLYVVQSGNRVIEDFFQVLEAASNTLESMEIVAKAIPAAGDYISSAAGFADQMQENIAENYTAAYTEAYEQSLACDLFCAARLGCELSIDTMIALVNDRLTAPLDIGDMGEIMAGIASGTWVGDEIADVAFLVYFSALKFGQQFGDQIGIRPLPVIMSLGADQLASDNWEVLCECADEWEHIIMFNGTSMPDGWTVPFGTFVSGSGIQTTEPSGGTGTARANFTPGTPFVVTQWETFFTTALAGDFSQIFSPLTTGAAFTFNFNVLAGGETSQGATGLPATFDAAAFTVGYVAGDLTHFMTGVRIRGEGFDPFA